MEGSCGVCGLGVWVFRRDNRDVMLCGRDGEEVDARAEHMRRGSNRDVVLLYGRVACSKVRQEFCQVEGRGVTPGPEVDHIPVRVVRLV